MKHMDNVKTNSTKPLEEPEHRNKHKIYTNTLKHNSNFRRE